MSGKYAPGQSLLTEVLANVIKIGGTPVRDALLKLETADECFRTAFMTAAKNERMKKEILRLHLINQIRLAKTAARLAPLPKNNTSTRRLVLLAMHEDIQEATAGSYLAKIKRLWNLACKI